ncbi:MAG: ATP-binding protein [Thermodesulfobacteriota bacterium]
MKAESDKNHQYYRILTRMIVVLMISISIIPLISIGGITIYYYSQSLKNNAIVYLETIVNKHKIHIDTFLEEKLADIQTLVDSTTVEQLLNGSFLRERLEILQNRYGDFVDLGVIDNRGYQRAYAGPFQLEYARYSDADWFKKAMTRDYFISDVFLGIRGLPHFIIAIKTKDNEGRIWIIRTTIDIEKFTSRVENIKIGKTGHAFILNLSGEFQTNPKFKDREDIHFVYSILKKTFPGASGVSVVETEKEKRKKVIYAISFLKNREWMLVCKQDSADAFSSLYHVRKLVIYISFVSFFSVLLISFLLTKKIVGRIERADMEKVKMREQVVEAGKLASIGELAAGIAHEVNNPVAIMVEEAGWMEDLLEEGELQSSDTLYEFRRALKQIRAQGIRCKQITHKLLSFARKTDSKLYNLNLNELIEEVVGLSQRTARYRSIKIETKLSPDIPPITASPSEVQQVLLNLINNAIDAIGKDGGVVSIMTHVDDGFVVIDVSDTGRGIPQADIQRIFDPFFTTKPVGKGTGLGLSICYGIIDRMGGRISVNSAPGKGTTFHVRLPIGTERKEV